jgi:hypothetical protein
MLDLQKFVRKGNMRMSSTSKTRKIIAMRKNRNVKGRRALNLGENPHSKGLIFSRSKTSFFLRREPANNTTETKIKMVNTNTR